MSNSNSEDFTADNVSGFDNRETLIVIVDEPGDTTVRPCSPEMRPILEAERAKIARWQEYLKQNPPPDQPPTAGS